MDVQYQKTAPSGAEFFECRAASGWYDSLRKFHELEVPTYLDPKSFPYELDHVFTDAGTYAALSNAEVLNGPIIGSLSDHAPVILDFG